MYACVSCCNSQIESNWILQQFLFDATGSSIYVYHGHITSIAIDQGNPYGTLRTGGFEDSDLEDTTLRTCDFEDRRL